MKPPTNGELITLFEKKNAEIIALTEECEKLKRDTKEAKALLACCEKCNTELETKMDALENKSLAEYNSKPPNDGGPAYPVVSTVTFEGRQCQINHEDARIESSGGMSLRAWLAGMAMNGLLASDQRQEATIAGATVFALNQADSMLAALAGKEGA